MLTRNDVDQRLGAEIAQSREEIEKLRPFLACADPDGLLVHVLLDRGSEVCDGLPRDSRVIADYIIRDVNLRMDRLLEAALVNCETTEEQLQSDVETVALWIRTLRVLYVEDDESVDGYVPPMVM